MTWWYFFLEKQLHDLVENSWVRSKRWVKLMMSSGPSEKWWRSISGGGNVIGSKRTCWNVKHHINWGPLTLYNHVYSMPSLNIAKSVIHQNLEDTIACEVRMKPFASFLFWVEYFLVAHLVFWPSCDVKPFLSWQEEKFTLHLYTFDKTVPISTPIWKYKNIFLLLLEEGWIIHTISLL